MIVRKKDCSLFSVCLCGVFFFSFLDGSHREGGMEGWSIRCGGRGGRRASVACYNFGRRAGRPLGGRQAGISHISHERGVLPHLEPFSCIYLLGCLLFAALRFAEQGSRAEKTICDRHRRGRAAFIVGEGVGHGERLGERKIRFSNSGWEGGWGVLSITD